MGVDTEILDTDILKPGKITISMAKVTLKFMLWVNVWHEVSYNMVQEKLRR